MESVEHLFSGFFIKTSTVAVARSLVDETGARFAEDVRTCEDYNFFWRALSQRPRVKYLRSADTRIRATPGSLTRRKNGREISRDNVTITSRIMRGPLDPALQSSLGETRYRAAQELLARSRVSGPRFLAETSWLFKNLGGARTCRAALSVLVSG
ncbi:MAG: hypothetical protein V2J26_00880 [Pacificimonas sp.]|nr:hypothetical protein [Pacificimonas sp.]